MPILDAAQFNQLLFGQSHDVLAVDRDRPAGDVDAIAKNTAPSVDLPEPDSPMMTSISPLVTSSDTSFTPAIYPCGTNLRHKTAPACILRGNASGSGPKSFQTFLQDITGASRSSVDISYVFGIAG